MLALSGESMLEMAGLAGSLRLGKETVAPVGGADSGAAAENEPERMLLVFSGGDEVLLMDDVGEDWLFLDEFEASSDSGVLCVVSGLDSTCVIGGEFIANAFDRKSA